MFHQFYVEICFAKEPTFSPDVSVSNISTTHTHAGTMLVSGRNVLDALGTVFEKTQNIDNSWKEGWRSSSVGDVFHVEDYGYYVVDNIGFNLIA
jgi:hypothetical protein